MLILAELVRFQLRIRTGSVLTFSLANEMMQIRILAGNLVEKNGKYGSGQVTAKYESGPKLSPQLENLFTGQEFTQFYPNRIDEESVPCLILAEQCFRGNRLKANDQAFVSRAIASASCCTG